MTREDIDILLGLREAVEANLVNDPVRVALDKRVPHAALVATQVKYLQRAKLKMPTFYAARCIIPPRAFEQASSEATALNKAYEGRLAVDLTCGLGVDVWALAQRFERVVAVERDPVMARLAEVNFGLLGLKNVEVVNAAAEDFAVPHDADLIYIDADRRGPQGQKLVLVQDCSPNVMELLPRLHARTVLKLSPMFDVDEAARLFGGRVEVVGSGGECREVVVEIDMSVERALTKSKTHSCAATIIGFGTIEYPDRKPHVPVPLPALRWLVAPDAALVKARLAARYFTERGLYIEGDNSFAFAAERPENVPGRVYRITGSEPYSSKTFGKYGIERADIMVRDFPFTAQQIAKALHLKEGGREKLAFTRIAGKLWMMQLLLSL
jgi:hypothetical protein